MGGCEDAPSRESRANMDDSDGVDKGVISNDGSPGDNWLGIAVAVVPGEGGEKGSGEAINNPFVPVVRCWTGALCWDPSA